MNLSSSYSLLLARVLRSGYTIGKVSNIYKSFLTPNAYKLLQTECYLVFDEIS